jgi:hypothetical protein
MPNSIQMTDPQKAVNRLGGLPSDLQAGIVNQLPLRSALALHAASKTGGDMPVFTPTLANRFMWSQANPFDALSLVAKFPGFSAMVKDHPIVSAGRGGWGSEKFCDRILGISSGASQSAVALAPEQQQQLLAWARANGCPWSAEAKLRATALSIPDGITSVGSEAFHKCPNLVSVTLPRSLARIEMHAFSGCERLVAVDFSAATNLTEIGHSAFSGTGLSDVRFPSPLPTLGDRAMGAEVFARCAELTSVDMSGLANLSRLPESTFAGCVQLAEVKFHPGLTIIGSRAFSGCSALTSVPLPARLTIIMHYSFSDCRSLTSIEFPSRLIHIGFGAYENCTGLTEVRLPRSVQTIDESAFRGCQGIRWSMPNPPVRRLVSSLVF